MLERLPEIGRIFYGIAIAAMGMLTICYRDFPYFLIPPNHSWMIGHILSVYVSGGLLFLAGVCIAGRVRLLPVTLMLGTVLFAIFCFYFIPYELMVSAKYMHFGQWENAAKELALAGGAFAIAGGYPRHNVGPFTALLARMIPLGILFPLTILSFGIDHFMYAKEAQGYIPSWVPNHLFWMYFTGTCLVGSSVAMLLNIKRQLFATLLGTMILIWVLILHIPKSVGAPFSENGGEIVSGFLALAYCGIAFVFTTPPDPNPQLVLT